MSYTMEWVKWLSGFFHQRATRQINENNSADDEVKIAHETDLHKAIVRHSSEITFLLDLAIDIETRDESGLTPLYLAIKRNFLSGIDLLLDRGASVNVKDSEGCTPLHFAVISRNENLVQKLINKGANREETDMYENTALQIAALNNDWDIFDILLSPENNYNFSNNPQIFPLMTILKKEYEIKDESLFELNALVNMKNHLNATPLHKAARKSKTNMVKILLDNGAEINSQDSLGQTPLQCAVQNDLAGIVKLLLDSGAGTDVRGNDNQEALLFIAIRKRNIEIITELLNHGADKEIRHAESNRTPLLFATFYNLTPEALLILEYGAEVNVSDSDSFTPIDYAIIEANFDLFQKLLDRGAQIQTNINPGNCAIGRMFDHSLEQTVNLILKNNFDINMRFETNTNKTPLHIVSGNAELVELLLNNGADLEAKNDYEETPVFTAMRHYSNTNEGAEGVELLLKKGADVKITDNEGKPLLHYAITNSQFVDILLHRGVDIEVKDKYGRTPILNAAYLDEEAESAVDILVKRGAKINVQDDYGKTLLHIFAVQQNPTLVRFLLDRGADINLKDNEGQTPFFDAVLRSYGDFEDNADSVITKLIENGSDVNSTNNMGRTVLFYNMSNNLLEKLLNSGADVNVKDNNGQTALHLAMIVYDHDNYDHVIDKFIENGASMLSVDNEGVTPLQMFLGKRELVPGRMSDVKPLLVAADYHGKTLLHIAVQEYWLHCLKHFIDIGVDINSKTKSGKTPLHLAAEESTDDSVEIMKELLSRGAVVNVQDKNKDTPLHKAVMFGEHREAIQALLLHGAQMDITNENGDTPFQLYRPEEPQDNVMVEHIVKLKAANLYGDITCNIESVDCSAFSSLNESCKKEVEGLKDYKFDCLSLFDVFNKSKDPMFASSSKMNEIIQSTVLKDQFPIYDSYLKVNLKGAEVRNTLLNEAAVVIADVMQSNLPNELYRKILTELPNKDLENLDRTCDLSH